MIRFIHYALYAQTSSNATEAKSQIDILKTSLAVEGLLKDYDNNVYNTVKIGTQVWMAENLKTTKYRNGDLIGTTNPATLDISGESTPKYQWPNSGNENNVATYGRLYTWFAVTDSRNVCPTGWHLPTDAEWTTLTDYLTDNGYGYEGSGSDIAKSMAAPFGWKTDPTAGNVGNAQASNKRSGFTTIPSGYRHFDGTFKMNNVFTDLWSSTEYDTYNGWDRAMNCGSNFVNRLSFNKQYGFSVRCLRD